nr:ABC transporter permease [Micromonospora sp. DSM 115978]
MNRILPAARLQFVNWPNNLGWPWGILTISFLINLAIFWSIDEGPDFEPTSGGVMSIYVVMLVASINSISQDFPFALGLGLTRRTFYLANVLQFTAQALVYAVLLYLLALIEDATGGWGLRLRFFGLPLLFTDNPLVAVLAYAMPFLLLGFLGIFIMVIYKRFGVNGMFTLATASLLGFGGGAVLITWQGWWTASWNWFADQPSAVLLVGWPALLTLPLAGASYLAIRRALP